jgi:hypothetical protein
VVLFGDYGPADVCDVVGVVLLGVESEVEGAGRGSWGFGDGSGRREGGWEGGMIFYLCHRPGGLFQHYAAILINELKNIKHIS